MFVRTIFVFMCVLTVFVPFLQSECPGTTVVVSNFHQKNCTDQATATEAYYLDRSQCIPKCKLYPTVVQDSQCTKDPNICVAGYSCENRCGTKVDLRQYECETDEDCEAKPNGGRSKCLKYCVLPDSTNGVTCMAYHSNLPAFVSTYWTAQKFKPVCDDDGTWDAKQCKGGVNGRCMCYDALGTRIFGESLYEKSKNMTCACSRRKAEMESNGRAVVSLHCDSMGNYESLQCDMEKELCWCVESKTGEPTAPFVPDKAKTKLPCYVTSQVGAQYLRQCESKKFAQLLIAAKLKAHGAQYVHTDTLLCDADGGYGAYSFSSGIASCTWRDNTKIGSWSTGIINGLNCYCARDFKRYNHNMGCDGNGNYLTVQQYTDEQNVVWYYCVDIDGFPKSNLDQLSTLNCTAFY